MRKTVVLLFASMLWGLSVCPVHADHLQCSVCEAGSYCFDDLSAACPDHSSSAPGSANASDCICLPGYYDQDNSCLGCSANFYCPGYPSTEERLPCPVHSTSVEMSDSLEDCVCEPGYTGNSGVGCAACAPGTFKSTIGSAACAPCPTNTYSANSARSSVCDSCPANTVSAPGSDSETDCVSAPGFFTDGSGNVAPCRNGTYQDLIGQTACKQCHGDGPNVYYSLTTAADSLSTCLLCPQHSRVEGNESGSSKGACVCESGYSGPDGGPCIACPAGTYKDNNDALECTPCPANSYSSGPAATSAASCLACFAHSTSPGGSSSIAQCRCDAGFYKVGDSCVACEAGKVQNGSDDTACTSCPPGTFEQGRVQCALCTANAYSTRGASACTCNAGYQPQGDQCAACEPGQYSPAKNSTCMDCPPSTWSASYATISCHSCPQHSGSTRSGLASVSGCICDRGYEGSAGNCSACLPGSYHPMNSTICHHCPGDSYAGDYGATACESCGAFAAAPEGSPQCVCVSAYTPSAQACVRCADGYYKSSPGNESCLACPTGSFSDPDAAACSLCPPNTYQDSGASAACTQCPANSVSGEGSTAVGSCECSAGFGFVDGACVSCPQGTYKPTVSNSPCAACDPGFYTEAVGSSDASQCILCAHDSYVEGGACVPCPAHSEGEAGSAAVSGCQCSAGFSGNPAAQEECRACLQGYYKSSAGSSACESCPSGMVGNLVFPRISEDSCQACSADTFQHNSTYCQPCPPHAASPAGSDSVHKCSCVSGYQGVAGEGGCFACSAGEYKNWTGDGDCAFCLFGKYSDAVAAQDASTCVSCPQHSTQLLPPPYTTVATCVCDAGFAYNRSQCHACKEGSWKYIGNYECVLCPASSYFPASFPAPFVSDLCTTCPGNSTSPEGSYGISSCVCQAGFHRVVDGSSVACEPCAPGKYCPDESQVVACPSHKSSPPGASHVGECTCLPGYHGQAGGGECEPCPVNHYCSGGEEVQQCPVNASTLSRSRQTNISACQCSPGMYEAQDGSCKVCPAKSYCYRDVIVACPPNSTSTPQATSVDGCLCDEGFRKSDERCEACPIDVLCLGGEHAPEPCARHALVVGQKCVCGAGAQEGYYCDGSDGTCSPPNSCGTCPADHWCVDNQRHHCPEGMHSPANSTHLRNCTCAEGTYQEGDICLTCPLHAYCTGGKRFQCTANDPHGITLFTGRSRPEHCICEEGYFRLSPTDRCKPCPKNFYCPSEHLLRLPNVVACPANMHTRQERSYDLAECICDAGFLMSESGDTTACTPCKEGERCQNGFVVEFMCHTMNRVPNTDHTKCICMPSYGEYELECKVCLPGSIKPTPGDFPCHFCPLDTYWRNTTRCESCPPHSTASPGSLACQCDAPRVMRDGLCEECEADEYYSQGVCVPCPLHSYSAKGSADISACRCDPGFHRKVSSNGTECLPCPPATFEQDGLCVSCGAGANSPEGSLSGAQCVCNASQCQHAVWGWDCEGSCETPPEPCAECVPGFFKATVSLPGNTESCHACGNAKYQPQHGASACESCAPTEHHSLLAQTNVSSCQCVAGYEPTGISSTPCKPCSRGYFKGSMGDFPCTRCPIGTYSDTEGALYCTSCAIATAHASLRGANTTHDMNSTSIEDCTCDIGLRQTRKDNVSICAPCVPGSFKATKGTHECDFCGALHKHLGSTYEHQYGTLQAGAVSDAHCSPCPQFSGQNSTLVGPGGVVLDEWTDCLCFGGYHNMTRDQCSACPEYMHKVGFSASPCTYCSDGTYFVSSFQYCGLCELRSAEDTFDIHSLLAINLLDPELAWGVSEADCSCRLGFERIGDNCRKCPPGQFRSSRAVRHCAVCAPDTYTNTSGAVECTACPPFSSTLHRNNSAHVTDCICDAGYQWNSETLSCDACPPGFFRTEEDVLRETLACVACPADHYPNAERDGCTMCPLNERAEPGSPSIEHCNCRPGYGNNSSPGACSPCPNATYSAGGDQAGNRHPACAACPAHKNSSVGSVAVGDCLCVPGYGTQPPHSSSDPCTPCADGKYSVGGHLEPCSSCGWGAISEPPLAATNFDACLCNSALGVYEA